MDKPLKNKIDEVKLNQSLQWHDKSKDQVRQLKGKKFEQLKQQKTKINKSIEAVDQFL